MTTTPIGTPATAQTSRLAITHALKDRLVGLLGAHAVFVAEIPDQPPVLVTDGAPDPSGRVAPYAIIWPGAGRPDLNPSLEATPTDHLWAGQVTFAAGFADDLLALLDDAIPLLNLWVPVIDGITCGPMRPTPGADPGPIRPERDARPPRFSLPTLWRLHNVTA